MFKEAEKGNKEINVERTEDALELKPEIIVNCFLSSTPIFIGNKLIAASSEGLWLFEILNDKIELIDHFMSTFESTPVVHNNKIYIASTDGYLYCFGK